MGFRYARPKAVICRDSQDVRVPFFIRGPGLPRGLVSDYPTTMVDVPATVLALAGGAWRGGRGMRPGRLTRFGKDGTL